MNYKDLNLYNEDQPLILKNEVKTESGALQTNKLKQEISKIKNITNIPSSTTISTLHQVSNMT